MSRSQSNDHIKYLGQDSPPDPRTLLNGVTTEMSEDPAMPKSLKRRHSDQTSTQTENSKKLKRTYSGETLNDLKTDELTDPKLLTTDAANEESKLKPRRKKTRSEKQFEKINGAETPKPPQIYSLGCPHRREHLKDGKRLIWNGKMRGKRIVYEEDKTPQPEEDDDLRGPIHETMAKQGLIRGEIPDCLEWKPLGLAG